MADGEEPDPTSWLFGPLGRVGDGTLLAIDAVVVASSLHAFLKTNIDVVEGESYRLLNEDDEELMPGQERDPGRTYNVGSEYFTR